MNTTFGCLPKSALLALGMAAALLPGPAAYAATPPDTLVVGKAADPQNLDPAFTMDNNDWTQTYPCYQRLVRYRVEKGRGSTNVEGDLAASWQASKNNLSWVFKLRGGQKFDDGAPVDAAAVKFSFDRLMKIAQGPSEPFPSDLKTDVVDPMTVKFTMGAVCPYFLYALANNGGAIVNPKVMDKAQGDDLAKAWLAGHTAGSGAFRLASWTKSQSLVLEQNPNFGGRKPVLKKMVVQIIAEPASRRLQLESGDLDIVETLPVDQMAEVAAKPGLTVAQNPSMLVTYLYLNCRKPPLDNPEVRQAISWAVDYDGIIKSIMKGQAVQMRGPIAIGMWGADPNVMQYRTDLAKAKALLAKNKIANLTLGFLYSSRDPNWEPIALSTQAQLAQVGINVKLENLANATMRERIDKADYDISIGNWSPDFADPFMFMNDWFDTAKVGLAGNRSFYSNPEVDRLVRQAAASTDQKQRTALYYQAQAIVVREAAYVYLFQRNSQVALSKAVKGFVFNPMLEQIFNIDTITK
jgi:peptide/nickel transport system substrate-binding protein